MIYYIVLENNNKPAIGGQINNLLPYGGSLIRVKYSRFVFLYKFIWLVKCIATGSKISAFMFWGIGYVAEGQKNRRQKLSSLSFKKNDIVIVCNQISPLGLIKVLKNACCRVIRWTDMPLETLLNQRYKLSSQLHQVLLKNEAVLVNMSDNCYTNELALQDHYKSYTSRARIVSRTISPVFFQNVKDQNINGAFNLIFVGVDYHRKRLDFIINLCCVLREYFDIELHIFGPSATELKNHTNNFVISHGYADKSNIVKTICSLKSKCLLNVTATRDEGAPIAMLELQALGAICFAPTDSGSVTYLANKANQYVDVNDLVCKISNILKSNELILAEIEKSINFANKYHPSKIYNELIYANGQE